MSILHDPPFGDRSHTLKCDLNTSPDCLGILDSGAADAPMGGYPSEDEAINAGLSHGWTVSILEDEPDACPPCWAELVARLGTGAA